MKLRNLALRATIVFSLLFTANASAALGDFQGSVALGPPFDVPVGIENAGDGTLWITDIGGSDFYTRIDTAGNVVAPIVDISAAVGAITNPLGIAADSQSVYITDANGTRVLIFDMAGNFTGSFDVSAQTTFPEGITINPRNQRLYVVDGAGGATVSEYTKDGTFIQSFAVQGASQDGLAYDSFTDAFWLYDSGTDTVRQYDLNFNEVTAFPGTIANALAGGEGVAVIGKDLFVVATGSDAIAQFDITGAQILREFRQVPTLGQTGFAILALLLLMVPVLRRQA